MFCCICSEPALCAQVLANFGASEFKCDVASLEADALQSIQQQVHQLPALFPVKVRSCNAFCIEMRPRLACALCLELIVSCTELIKSS